MKRRAAIIVPFLLFLFALSMKSKQEYKNDDIKETIKYDTMSRRYFRYVYEGMTDRLLVITQLDSATKKENGVSYSFEENGDTSSIEYYKMGAIMPLYLYFYRKDEGWGVDISEMLQDKGLVVDSWRSKFYTTTHFIAYDTIYLNYSFKGALIFKETYYWGECLSRNILNQSVYDSLLNAYNDVTGKQLFHEMCISCHRINSSETGPGLKGITQKYSETWLRDWIRNPAKMIANHDKQAMLVYNKWNGIVMTSFPLPEKEMDKLIAYLKTMN